MARKFQIGRQFQPVIVFINQRLYQLTSLDQFAVFISLSYGHVIPKRVIRGLHSNWFAAKPVRIMKAKTRREKQNAQACRSPSCTEIVADKHDTRSWSQNGVCCLIL